MKLTQYNRYYFVNPLGVKIYVKLLAWIWNDTFVYAEGEQDPEKKYHVYKDKLKIEQGE